MKKLVVFFVILLSINSFAFSEPETLFFGSIYQCSFLFAAELPYRAPAPFFLSTAAPGIDVNIFHFWKEDIGIHANVFYLFFPGITTILVRPFRFERRFGGTLGSVFRYSSSEKITGLFSIGLNFISTTDDDFFLSHDGLIENNKKTFHTVYSVGVYSDFGIKYTILKFFSINAGISIIFPLLHFTTGNGKGEIHTPFSKQPFVSLEIKPYILFSTNVIWKKAGKI